eukprot:2221808-Lingulodinium_polyedra.AAC.1
MPAPSKREHTANERPQAGVTGAGMGTSSRITMWWACALAMLAASRLSITSLTSGETMPCSPRMLTAPCTGTGVRAPPARCCTAANAVLMSPPR